MRSWPYLQAQHAYACPGLHTAVSGWGGRVLLAAAETVTVHGGCRQEGENVGHFYLAITAQGLAQELCAKTS